MHELSIVMSIIDIAEDEVEKNHALSVDSIDLEIGSMSGVELSALDFAWDAGVRNTVLEKASKKIHVINAKARCMDCGCEFEVSDRFQPCPRCHDYLTEFIQGKELRVKSLVLS